MSDAIKSLPLFLLQIKGHYIVKDFKDKFVWLLPMLIYSNNFV